MKSSDHTPQFIKLAQVRELTSLSTAEIYRRVSEGSFPKQVRIGVKGVAWIYQEVLAWMESTINASRCAESL